MRWTQMHFSDGHMYERGQMFGGSVYWPSRKTRLAQTPWGQYTDPLFGPIYGPTVGPYIGPRGSGPNVFFDWANIRTLPVKRKRKLKDMKDEFDYKRYKSLHGRLTYSKYCQRELKSENLKLKAESDKLKDENKQMQE